MKKFVYLQKKCNFIVILFLILGSQNIFAEIDMTILVAFDKNFNRLGYGAGFYDRFIYSLKKVKKIITIGLAFHFQQVNSIPISRYDQRLDYIITNKEILK